VPEQTWESVLRPSLLNVYQVAPEKLELGALWDNITVLGGNSFGMMGPIVTGFVVALTGSFNGTFAVAGVLALIGAVATLSMTRRPIEAYTELGRGVAVTV